MVEFSGMPVRLYIPLGDLTLRGSLFNLFWGYNRGYN